MDESAAGRLTVGATALVARVEVVRAAAVRAAAVRAAVVRAAAVRCHEHQLHEGRERAKRERERELLGRGAVAQQRVGAAPPDLGSCGAQRRHLDSCERACVTKREMRDKGVKLPKNGGTADVIHINASEHVHVTENNERQRLQKTAGTLLHDWITNLVTADITYYIIQRDL